MCSLNWKPTSSGSRIEEERTRLATLTAQLDGIRKEIMAEEEVQRQEHQVARLILDEARARHREAEGSGADRQGRS